MKGFLGIDVGSVSTNVVVIDECANVISHVYLRTRGRPIEAIQMGLNEVEKDISLCEQILGVGVTGSGRYLAAALVGADVVKNEITAQAVAASRIVPDVRTVIEIGGQDSKVIILRNGVVTDFGMNTICAAGTGSFLDQQASRLNIRIEEFGRIALDSKSPVRIAGRCSVFAESDMIHKQQMGHKIEDILYGLCQALVRNFLNNVAKGKDIQPPVVFQGGVAGNIGIKKAFEETFGYEITVPPYHDVTGALGAALLAKEEARAGVPSRFRGIEAAHATFEASSFECTGCPNRCEIVQINCSGKVISRWGGRCDRWDLAQDTTALEDARIKRPADRNAVGCGPVRFNQFNLKGRALRIVRYLMHSAPACPARPVVPAAGMACQKTPSKPRA